VLRKLGGLPDLGECVERRERRKRRRGEAGEEAAARDHGVSPEWGAARRLCAFRDPPAAWEDQAAFLSNPSAAIASCTAGRAATRSWNATRFGNSERSSFTYCAHVVTVKR